MDYLLLVVGFVLLLKGADFFVEGSSSIAKRLRVPSLIIGLTIVAMGTSLPECAVSISAAIAGNTGVAVGNAVGSNIFNLMVVCGVCALFCPLTVSRGTLTGEFPFSVIVAVDGVHQIGVVHHYLRRLFGEFLSFRVHHVDKSCICQILDVIHHRGSGCLYVVGQLAYVGRFRSVHGQQI